MCQTLLLFGNMTVARAAKVRFVRWVAQRTFHTVSLSTEAHRLITEHFISASGFQDQPCKNSEETAMSTPWDFKPFHQELQQTFSNVSRSQ